MTVNILILEDDSAGAEHLANGLRSYGHGTMYTDSCDECCALVMSGGFDLLILETFLPNRSGFSFINELREKGSFVLIIAISSSNETHDKVAALDLGADEYLTKPFLLDELEIRARALSRRCRIKKEPVLSIGNARVDFGLKSITVEGIPEHLTATEWCILEVLAEHRGRNVSSEVIREHLHFLGYKVQRNSIPVLIGRLRDKLSSEFDRFAVISSGWKNRPDTDQTSAYRLAAREE